MNLNLSIKEYRALERKARSEFPYWQMNKIFDVPAIDKASFPKKYLSHIMLRQFVDTFQEGRFFKYMAENGGLTNYEKEMLQKIIQRNIEFQKITFPNKEPIVPFDAAISGLKIAGGIFALKPQCESILEIGAGSGFVPQFLDLLGIKKYITVEACESLYLYQDLLFRHVFKDKFCQGAFAFNDKDIGQENYRFVQLPVWKLSQAEAFKYDIITANANLTELSSYALGIYLNLINKCLKDDGVLFVSCFGESTTPIGEVLMRMASNNLVPIYYAHKTITVAFFVKANSPLLEGKKPPLWWLITKKFGRKVPFWFYNTKFVEFKTNCSCIKLYEKMLNKAPHAIYTKEAIFQ